MRSQSEAGVKQQCSSPASSSSPPISPGLKKDRPDLEVDPDEEDSFFDNPLPQPQKTYGGSVQPLLVKLVQY